MGRQVGSATDFMRANVRAYLALAGYGLEVSGLGQVKSKYRAKAGSSAPSGSPAESIYDIVPKGNCNWQKKEGALYGGGSYTQDAWAQKQLGTTRLTFSQIASLFGDAAVPVTEAGTGRSGWYIGRGNPAPSRYTGAVVSGGIAPSSQYTCENLNFAVSGFDLATPDGGLVPIVAGVYKPGMAWSDFVELDTTPPPPPTLNFQPTVLNQPPPPPPPACSTGYQRPSAGTHITCTPGYGWIADPSGSGCETCSPLCSPGWLPQDQAPSSCPAGEYMAIDRRTNCVKCLPGSNCFKPGENPVPCGPPFALEARGQYTCCVTPTQQQAPATQDQSAQQTSTASAATSPGMSTGAKVAIGGAVALALYAFFKKKG